MIFWYNKYYSKRMLKEVFFCMSAGKKVKLGQFFTTGSEWLKPQIRDFIIASGCTIAYDPFAGEGHLLDISPAYGIKITKGLDIDNSLGWDINDSLKNIPTVEKAIIITNPPYLAKQSATRKKIDLSEYFNSSAYDDLYLIALDKMLDAQKYVVAIIPESFINSSFKRKHLLYSITILEDNPFNDTDAPVCVVCFDGVEKDFKDIKVYKNGSFENNLKTLESIRLKPKRHVKMSFNNLNGWLGIRAVDMTDDNTFITFDFKENFKYDWGKRIKESSRHYTLVDIEIEPDRRQAFIDKCNEILTYVRVKSADTILTPFMGNTKKGVRRRRLDFKLARSIMEKSHDYVYNKSIKEYESIDLFNLE